MSGSSIGRLFRLTSFGESHGPAIGGVLDGVPAGLRLIPEDIQKDLDRRKPGQSKFTTQRKESDKIQLLSGVFEDKTLGSPIGFIIPNEDQKSKDYSDIQDIFRPGHGDYTYFKKYGHRDYRGGGRASARETAVRVAAGAIAKIYLKAKFGIEIVGFMSHMGDIKSDPNQWDLKTIEDNPFFCPQPNLVPTLEQAISAIRKQGDSIGAQIEVHAMQVPVGLGEPVYNRLDADLAHALMSINAVKGVGIGDGFDCVAQTGSQHRDEMTEEGFLSNHSGGILAGISSGQTIRCSIALKPTSSILTPGKTLNEQGDETTIKTKGRHDPCVGIRAVPVAEAMVALVLADHVLQCYGNQPVISVNS